MRTKKPTLGTFIVLFLSLLFAAASVGVSVQVDGHNPAVSALDRTAGIKADARPHSEEEWIESKALESGEGAPDPALAVTVSYPVEGHPGDARARIASHAQTHRAYRQAPPATGPPGI